MESLYTGCRLGLVWFVYSHVSHSRTIVRMLNRLQTLGEKSEADCRCRRRTNSLTYICSSRTKRNLRRRHLQYRRRINTRTIRLWQIWGWIVLRHTPVSALTPLFSILFYPSSVSGEMRVYNAGKNPSTSRRFALWRATCAADERRN